MSSHKCTAGLGGRYFAMCHAKGKVERDGKWYCGVHDPVRLLEKHDARVEKWRAEDEEKSRIWREAEKKRSALVCDANRYRRLRENWIDCEELNLHGRLSVIDVAVDALIRETA